MILSEMTWILESFLKRKLHSQSIPSKFDL